MYNIIILFNRRIRESIENPNTTCSIIEDGMSQNNNMMPSLSDQDDFTDKLQTHNQGILEHGQVVVSYSY